MSKKFFDKFQQLKGVSFIGINNYLSKTSGEIANHLINVNLSVTNAKETDLKRLKGCTDIDLITISTANNLPILICYTALSELIVSGEKNLSENIEDRTAQSQAQTDTYIHLTPSIRMNKETGEIHIFGQAISKTVIIKGEYKTVKSNPKTLAKQAIKKHFNLRSDKFRTFIVGNADSVKITGETIVL